MRRADSTAGAIVAITAIAMLALPAAASATTCPLTGPDDASFDNVALDVEGDVAAERTGGYLQIPFRVPAGTTAIRVRYSYDQPQNGCSAPPGGPSNTLDIGLYEPRPSGAGIWKAAQSRGWSGSAVKDLAVAVNGFSGEAVYESDRKAFRHGFTTRAYRPGAIPAGEWAVELGLGFIDGTVDLDDSAHYRVLVETTSDTDWSTGHPYDPVPGDPTAVIRDEARWYAGDVHVHGEMEPGNATMTQTFQSAFSPMSTGGGGLDFVTINDHNNDVAHDNLGPYQAANPDNLIVPGTEVTTYRGHYNNQGTGPFVDFRGGPIYAADPDSAGSNVSDGELRRVGPPLRPRRGFRRIEAGPGFTQINHPTIFRNQPSFCRGCAWDYSDVETNFTRVDAIELQTGPASLNGTVFNPFTREAIDYYEHALDSGAKIAAVGSSDDHQGGQGSGPTYSPVGRATTMVYASELSERGVIDAVENNHTYVKLFGNDGPEISLSATVPFREKAIIGDSVKGRRAEFLARVRGAASTGREGAWTLNVLKDGMRVESVPFTGDRFRYRFDDTGSGRYALEVTRNQTVGSGTNEMVENYSSPIWFTKRRSG